MKVNTKKKIQNDNELGIIVIVLTHLPVKSIFLEKYIIAYETTNRHILTQNGIYSPRRVAGSYRFTRTGFCGLVPDRQQYIYICIFCVPSLGRVLLAFLASRV